MAFRGITFSGQNVTPKNDGALYNAHYGDGILEGCSMAISGDDLVIQSGHIIACGRVCQVDGATNVDLSGRTLQTGYIQVILNYDISQGEGQQWFPTFIESAALPFPALTQEDINTPSGTIYQLELAVVQVSGGNLTSIYRRMDPSSLIGIYLSRLIAEDNSINMDMYADSAGGGIRSRASGNDLGGVAFPQSGSADAVIYGSGDSVFIRPNGVSNENGRATFYPNGDFRIGGQMLGGITTLTANALVSAVGAGANTVVARINSGLDPAARYLILGYFGGTPSSSGSGSTDMAIDVDGTNVRIESIFSNSAIAKFRTLPAWIIGASSKIELRVWSSGQYAWNNIVAQLQVIRLG